MKAGDRVVWSYEPRGGYGYVIPVDAVVMKVNPKTIRICAPLVRGGTREVNVKPEKIRKKD